MNKTSEPSAVVDIIILTYNQLELSKKCFESLVRSTHQPVRVIIIDNGSTDGTREYLNGLKDTSACRFEVIHNKENAGFIRGTNQGLALSDAPYICFTNNDVIFTDGWLDEILALFIRRPDIGLLNPNSNNLGRHLPKGVAVDDFGRETRDKFSGQFMEMPFCVGFCCVIRREVYEAVGGLSEDYLPMYFEDTDFSRRVVEAGYRIGAARGAYVWHRTHGSLDQDSEEGRAVFEKSKAAYTKRWGKMLRVGLVFRDEREARQYLEKAVDISREGNFVWLLIRKFHLTAENLFCEKKRDFYTHVKCVGYYTFFDLLFYILVRKKKFDCIFTTVPAFARLLTVFGQPAYRIEETGRIGGIKHASA